MQGFFSGINNLKEMSFLRVVYSTEESIAMCVDNGPWSLEFAMYPQSMQFVCFNQEFRHTIL